MPLAISVNAALTYYESMGQNWERAAMIKARPVAGDLKLGADFLTELRSTRVTVATKDTGQSPFFMAYPIYFSKVPLCLEAHEPS